MKQMNFMRPPFFQFRALNCISLSLASLLILIIAPSLVAENIKTKYKFPPDTPNANSVLSTPPTSASGDSKSDCGIPPTTQALESYLRCKDKVSSAGGSATKAFLVDVDTQRAWIINKDGNTSSAECIPVTVGSGSQNGDLGNHSESHQTPGGLLLTEPHSSDKFPSNSCVGLGGTSSINSNTSDRGVLIHEAHAGQTWGCIGIRNGLFSKVKNELSGSGSPVFVWGKKLDAAHACDGGGKGASKESSSGTTN
jgi:hypothetical protein